MKVWIGCPRQSHRSLDCTQALRPLFSFRLGFYPCGIHFGTEKLSKQLELQILDHGKGPVWRLRGNLSFLDEAVD